MHRVGVAAAVAAALLGAAGFAGAKDATIKEMMGENFAGLQTILVALVTSNYAKVPDQVELIRAHAADLTRAVPESAEAHRDQFLTYAYNLQAHAADLKSISLLLVQRDAARGGAGDLAIDQLREAAAAHYGGMVTMCVACHNRFRPRVVP